jgi:enoyl-CoA hydratase/carnithine racemase
MGNEISININNRIAIVSINRQEVLNALSKDIINELDNIIEDVKKNRDVHVLIFHSDKNFAAGADIKQMSVCNPEEAKKFIFTHTYNKICDLDIPTIAAIEGYAFGGGLELALCCDFRIMGKNAKIGLTELNLGIIPGAGGTVRLPRIVGESKAKEMIFMSKVVDGVEAEKIGLSNFTVDDEKVYETAIEWAEKLKRKSIVSLVAAKKSIRNGIKDSDYHKSTCEEAEIWSNLFSSYDQKEGMRAFFEKRKPNFINE